MPARDTVDIWPPLPLIIRDVDDIFDGEPSSADIVALEHKDRVCQIQLDCCSICHVFGSNA
jgi:hypothetical protein